MAILKKKIESDQLERYHIPEDVLQFIATNIKSNIRELEGSLNKLIALYKLKNEEINISLAAEALKDLISPDENRKITPELIIETVSEHFGISVADLKSASRDAKTTSARHIAMYLCRSMTDTPLKMIGSLLGGRDHSTVKHGVDKVSKDMENNDSLKNTISIIQKKSVRFDGFPAFILMKSKPVQRRFPSRNPRTGAGLHRLCTYPHILRRRMRISYI